MAHTTIVADYPPNIKQIRYHLDPPNWAIFAYNDTIYAPNRKELEPDIVFHEEVHLKQQKKFRNAGEWWDKYLTDSSFRQQEEVEAYGKQYLWLKDYGVTAKDMKEALQEMALALSLWYNLPLSIHQAETLIRLYESSS